MESLPPALSSETVSFQNVSELSKILRVDTAESREWACNATRSEMTAGRPVVRVALERSGEPSAELAWLPLPKRPLCERAGSPTARVL